ncbi:MAG TPA: CoA transferase, partial [Bryobacteraceae bacterium]|nr:CoA transferase [Bryobacteraceae bacterium]
MDGVSSGRAADDGARSLAARDGHAAFAPYGDFETADSRILIGISNDRLFDRFSKSIGLATDARFSTNAARVENRGALDAAIGKILERRTTAEWLEIFDRAGVPASAIQSAGELLKDPQLAALGQMSDALAGWRSPNLPIEFSGFAPARGAPPRLGEHTREVLLDAGIDANQIDRLAKRRIVECLASQKARG